MNIEYIGYIGGFFDIIFQIPQIYKIFLTNSVHGISFLTNILYFIANLVWIIYGYYIKSYALLISASFCLVFNIIIMHKIVQLRDKKIEKDIMYKLHKFKWL